MRKFLLLLFAGAALASAAQSRKPAKMAPIYASGYFISKKGDTVHGKVQINPDDETDFYKRFVFVNGKAKKGKVMTAQNTNAYGFAGKNFVMIPYNGQKLFMERLTVGRLRFYEYQFNGKVNGVPGVVSIYFIKDTYAEGDNVALKNPKRLSSKFYKKSLKPYLQDQPMLWSDLDKYSFNPDKVVQTINEFNQFYTASGN